VYFVVNYFYKIEIWVSFMVSTFLAFVIKILIGIKKGGDGDFPIFHLFQSDMHMSIICSFI
jgi:hypothetical protein